MTNEACPGSRYPAMPGEPVRDLAPLGPPPPPVANAVRLMLLQAALNLLELPLLFATKDSSLRDQIRKANPRRCPRRRAARAPRWRRTSR
jgi:hypothetical protein